MARTTVSDTIVIVDDEQQNVIWMIDYFESSGTKVILASNVNEAINVLEREVYRAIIVDLNIPALDPFEEALLSLGPTYKRFPGLFVARRARNRGYRDRQVIIYSVHRDPGVAEEAKKLGCTYIIKGRPREIKKELASVLAYDPTAP